jgi:nicotinic acid mononucleotide adenylyltransferase
VSAVSGGGSLAVSDLMCVAGASRTVLEAIVPYSTTALDSFIGVKPDSYCCEHTARQMAMLAFHRGMKLIQARKKTPAELLDYVNLVGISCTAALSTDREKRGEHRIFIATQTLRRTTVCSLVLTKGKRTRAEEERLAADLVLNMIADAQDNAKVAMYQMIDDEECELGELDFDTFSTDSTNQHHVEMSIPLDISRNEMFTAKRVTGTSFLTDLFFGKTEAILWKNEKIRHVIKSCDHSNSEQRKSYNPHAIYSNAIFPGSFNPIHDAHVKIIKLAKEQLSCIVSIEMSVLNFEKPPVDFISLAERLNVINSIIPDQPVWLTRVPDFVSKSKLFSGTVFVVGIDTLRRFADLSQYDNMPHRLQEISRDMARRCCKFLVFLRRMNNGETESLETLDLPDILRDMCDEVPVEKFLMDISSTEIRRGNLRVVSEEE